jgi:hypothetical protein
MIDSYRFGLMVIEGKKFSNDCIVTENNVYGNWWRKKGHELAVEDIKEVIEREKPEVVVIGKGKYGLMKIPEETERFLQDLGIEIKSSNTDEAVKMYNELCKKKKVVGCFHLTC